MKTTIIYLIMTGAVLFSGMNVYAGGNKDKKNKAKKSVTVAKMDAEVKIEKWMTELKAFTFSQEIFAEKELTLEDWMTEDFTNNINTFTEGELQLENWMTEDFSNALYTDNFTEEELQLEEWMTNSFTSEENFVDQELVLEEWMYTIQ
jgi:hypothetical protein